MLSLNKFIILFCKLKLFWPREDQKNLAEWMCMLIRRMVDVELINILARLRNNPGYLTLLLIMHNLTHYWGTVKKLMVDCLTSSSHLLDANLTMYWTQLNLLLPIFSMTFPRKCYWLNLGRHLVSNKVLHWLMDWDQRPVLSICH